MALLRSIPGADVIEVDAGCCGMAGSFGFEAEHYELSMSIGELRLFPAVRAEAGDAVAHYAERFRDTFKELGDSIEDTGKQLSDWLRTARRGEEDQAPG